MIGGIARFTYLQEIIDKNHRISDLQAFQKWLETPKYPVHSSVVCDEGVLRDESRFISDSAWWGTVYSSWRKEAAGR